LGINLLDKLKHSIFLKIHIIFTISILSLIVLFAVSYNLKVTKEQKEIFFKASTLLKVVNRFSRDDFDEYLRHQNLKLVEYDKDITSTGELVKPRIHRNRKYHHDGYTYIVNDTTVKALIYDNRLFYDVEGCNGLNILVEDNNYGGYRLGFFSYVYLAIFIILIFLYILLLNSLNPLKRLTLQIKKFGKGNLDIDTKTDKKDEIAILANEFDNAVKNIKNLKSARELFLRNIMHELKTPITKGKLCVSLIDNDDTNTKILTSLFDRLDLLINEMADMTRVSSDIDKIEKKEYRVIDILDSALDILYLDHVQVSHNITSQKLTGDFKLLTILFKNLIDNALKYSSDGHVEIIADESKLEFVNSGKELDDFERLKEPFHKGMHTHTNQKGFGLGLYIINQIASRHSYELNYQYIENKNIFIIKYR
jgi:two-component system OmpR family sensor kinase